MPIRVLLVDDDVRLHELLASYLEQNGVQVTRAYDGASGLAQIDVGTFDAVLLDVMMPGTDGLSLARLVAERHPDMPIVLTSAFHFFPAQLSRLGINHLYFLDKPLDVARLFALLETEGHKPH